MWSTEVFPLWISFGKDKFLTLLVYGCFFPQYSWDFPEEIREKFLKKTETFSELFLELPWRVRLGSPKPIIQCIWSLQAFPDSLPLSTAGDASFSEVVPERASQSWSCNSGSTEDIFSDFSCSQHHFMWRRDHHSGWFLANDSFCASDTRHFWPLLSTDFRGLRSKAPRFCG